MTVLILCGFVVVFFWSFIRLVLFRHVVLSKCVNILWMGEEKTKFSGYLLCAWCSVYAIDKCDFSPNEWPHDHINIWRQTRCERVSVLCTEDVDRAAEVQNCRWKESKRNVWRRRKKRGSIANNSITYAMVARAHVQQWRCGVKR